MKALVDTCIIVDFLQAREPFAESARAVLRAAAAELCLCCITAKSATDIYYLTHRCTHNDKESRSKLEQLLSIVGMLDSAADDVLRAIPSEVSDFEDAVMIGRKECPTIGGRGRSRDEHKQQRGQKD